MADLLRPSECGLYCEAGDFYIDPWKPVDRAVITHAHSDHASPGSARYLCSEQCVPLARLRLGEEAAIDALPYGQTIRVNEVDLTLYPAGHVLGSAQVCVEHGGERWVVSGDYKLAPDPTCQPFELVTCDVFISEATFGLPIYHWPRPQAVFEEIHQWWRDNQREGRTSVLYAYTLGKCQRILAGLDQSAGPIFVHGSMLRYIEAYRSCGVELPEVRHAVAEEVRKLKGQAIVILPPATTNDLYLRKLGPVSQAAVSGWMRVRGRRRWRSLDRGFILSDHADWDHLHQAIRQTGAARVGITHGYVSAMARYLSEQGMETFIVPTRYTGEAETEQPEGVPEA